MSSKSGTLSGGTQKLLACCGIMDPLIYTVVLAALGFLQPGYNHVTQSMSELNDKPANPRAAMEGEML